MLDMNIDMNIGDFKSFVQKEAPPPPPEPSSKKKENSKLMRKKGKEAARQVPTNEGFEVNFLAKDDDPNQ